MGLAPPHGLAALCTGHCSTCVALGIRAMGTTSSPHGPYAQGYTRATICLLYTSDAADEGLGVDLGGRRIIKKKIYNATSGSVN